jgi:hypothetical protein
MRLGSRVKVGGWICAISLPERWYGCRNVGFGPNFTIFCYQIDLGSNHTHQSKINGGENLPLKDLVRGPVCWAKMVHFWKPWEHAFWPSPECWEPFSMLPRHALSSFMVWNAGVGPWWAATAENFKSHAIFWQYSHRSQTFVLMGPANSVPNTLKVCRGAHLSPAWGPAYSELGGSFGAKTLTGMADLTCGETSFCWQVWVSMAQMLFLFLF